LETYSLLINEQLLIGWDNLLRGKFSKQRKIQQRAYVTRIRLKDPASFAQKQNLRKITNNQNKHKQKKNKTEAFHSFFQSIVPLIHELWKDRCIDRHQPATGGRVVAEYESLTKKITQLYTMRELVLPEDEAKIFQKSIGNHLTDTNQQLKKWLTRWRPVIDHGSQKVGTSTH
jgi:hypothetical protein